jgi:hypothetical protein
MKTIAVPLKLINLQDDGFHLLVEIVVFAEVGYAVVDTGASRSVFDKGLLERHIIPDENAAVPAHVENYATTLFSTSSTALATIPVLGIGKLKIKNYVAVGLDLKSVSDTYEQFGHPRIAGILGGDILINYHAVIDYKKLLLKLYK